MKKFMCLLLGLVVLLPCRAATPDDKSHLAAAEQLLVAMKIDQNTDATIDTTLDIQIKQQPQLAPFKDVMKKFLSKHLGWASVKDQMIKLYAETYSEDELKEITAFYQTKVGKKAAEMTPRLFAKGAQIGMERVQANLPELEKMIQDARAGK